MYCSYLTLRQMLDDRQRPRHVAQAFAHDPPENPLHACVSILVCSENAPSASTAATRATGEWESWRVIVPVSGQKRTSRNSPSSNSSSAEQFSTQSPVLQ